MSKGGGTFSFFLVMILAMVAYSVPFIRDGIGSATATILDPLFSALGFSWVIIILVLSAITGCYSSLLQKYTIDYDKMQAVQEKMKEFQKIYREAQLAGDEKKLKKLNDKRDKMMQDQLAMSQEQFKPMVWIMIITVPIFLWLLYKKAEMGVVTFPYLGTVNLIDPAFFLPGWILWYMICSLTLSQVIRKTLNIGGL